jgi:hypothetical protein
MDKLYELRVYVTHPGRYSLLHDQWEADHFAIYADYHVVLGGFDALSRDGVEVGTGAELGIAVFMEHEDRAAVDRSMKAVIASNRMNEIGGPPGETIVHHWERTFLYPLVMESDLVERAASPSALYELRQFATAEADLEPVSEQWSAQLYDAYRSKYDVRGLFVAHPESSAMPTGVALLLRHVDLAAANRTAGPEILAELDQLADGARVAVAGCSRQLLRPMAISPMQ